jgi:hypothetical protein
VKEVAVSFVRRLTLEEKTCPVCHKRFEGVKKRIYCSRACQAKADYVRNAEAYRASRMKSYRKSKGVKSNG